MPRMILLIRGFVKYRLPSGGLERHGHSLTLQLMNQFPVDALCERVPLFKLGVSLKNDRGALRPDTDYRPEPVLDTLVKNRAILQYRPVRFGRNSFETSRSRGRQSA